MQTRRQRDKGVVGIAYIKAPRRKQIYLGGSFTISLNAVRATIRTSSTSKWPETITHMAIELVDGSVWYQRAGQPPLWLFKRNGETTMENDDGAS